MDILFNLRAAKEGFFDRKPVIDATDRATRKVLSRFGAYVRSSARQSIRKRKRASHPGNPPSSHTGLLKRFIFFVYDKVSRNVVIGPTLLNRQSTFGGRETNTVPEVLEYGGRTIGRNRKRDVYIDARPYMGPAFAKEQPKLPDLWANSIRT